MCEMLTGPLNTTDMVIVGDSGSETMARYSITYTIQRDAYEWMCQMNGCLERMDVLEGGQEMTNDV
jgi:hypothetical protein